MDDFYGQIKLSRLLNILDGHPLQVPIKSSSTWANYTVVYITSNCPIEDWYPNIFDSKPLLKEALLRRIKSISYINKP